ncbi:hypothetical protein V8E36_005728 [Tilletia maclaganii]
MAAFQTILTALLGVLALWSIIEAGVATRSAKLLFQVSGRFVPSAYKTMRNGAALLAFDGFLTFFLALALVALFVRGRGLPPLPLLAIFGVLWVLWLGGAAAFSNGFDELGFTDCDTSDCGTVKAAVAFAWLGWLNLSALLGLLVFLVVKRPEETDGTTHASPSFSMAAFRKSKKNQSTAAATDVEKAHQQQPSTAAGAPYGTMPAPATNTAPGYHGQAPDQQAFAGAYGAPASAQHEHQHQHQQPAGGAPYDAAQAYAHQAPPAHNAAQQPPSATAASQPQAPAGWSVAPLGTAPQPGAAPTAEILAGPPRQD